MEIPQSVAREFVEADKRPRCDQECAAENTVKTVIHRNSGTRTRTRRPKCRTLPTRPRRLADAPAARLLPMKSPINPNPVTPPSPIETQVPAEQPQRRPSRLETIENAFKKHEASRPKPKAAEAKMGHNQPPEEMEEEEKFDLRRRPKDQPREKRQVRRQGACGGAGNSCRGRSRAQPGEQPGARPAPPQLPEHAPYRAPPPRMHPQAQADWHACPESVRGEVHRMAREFNDAYQRSQADVAGNEPDPPVPATGASARHHAEQGADRTTREWSSYCAPTWSPGWT